jgi:hypothetical protein
MLPEQWPKWSVIVIALVLIVVSVVFALALEPVAQAVSPEVTAVPTPHRIEYGLQISQSCQDCHFDRAALAASAEPDTDVDAVLIARESVAMVHGRLGCVTCHRGDGRTDDKVAAHQDLIVDLTATRPKDCLACHTDLPALIPGDRLRVPHGRVAESVEQDRPCGVTCSDCHGAVGHGFDPVSGEIICSMTVCQDCHQEQNLEIQTAGCDACHLGPHDIASGLACDDCHASLESWSVIEAVIHPKLVTHGKHADLACFECHTWPDFQDLHKAECVDCHESGHEQPADTDCAKCHDIGMNWRLTNVAAIDHTAFWDFHQGAHRQVDCRGCHLDRRYLGGLEANCAGCHAPDEETCKPDKACVACHLSDRAWSDVQ